MRKIRLWHRSDALKSRGKYALVDDEDYARLSQFTWQAIEATFGSGYWYAMSQTKKPALMMHRVILSAKPGEKVNHINGNGLDNRRQNLRIATTSQNGMNSRARSDKVGRYKGVMWEKDRKKWVVRIKVDDRYLNLWSF